MSTPLSSSAALLLGLVFAYLLVVGLLTYGLPRILMGSQQNDQSSDPGQGAADQPSPGQAH